MNPCEVHMWSVGLEASEHRTRDFLASLPDDEKQRAHAFRFEKHQRRFIIGRGLLRALLGSYTGKSPKEIVLRYGAKGKPSLQGCDATSLYFNLTHSEDQIVYAFCRDRDLGVDLERIREVPDLESVSRRFFADEECKELLCLSPVQRNAAFFNCWTRKEACLKAVGDGLFVPLDRFQVSLKPGDGAAVLGIDGDGHAAAEWTLLHLTPLEEYVGAIALRAPGITLRECKFQDAEQCMRYLKSVPDIPS